MTDWKTFRRHSATSWNLSQLDFWSTTSLVERASGLIFANKLISYYGKWRGDFKFRQVWRREVLCWQALGGSQLQPCAWGDPIQLCLRLSRCHTVCGGGDLHKTTSALDFNQKSFCSSWWRTSSTQWGWPSQWLVSPSLSFSICSCLNWGTSQVGTIFVI